MSWQIGQPAQAFVTSIAPAPRSLYLQVGLGTMSGGTFSGGGTPGNNSVVNKVSVTVPANSLGTGSVPMTSDSTVANSPFDNYPFCAPPAQVYVGGFYRRNDGSNSSASLMVTTPSVLTNASTDSIPFNTISWTSSGAGDATATIPSGTFAGGAQTLLSIGLDTWFESCLTFQYANSAMVAAGTFTGRATFTLAAP